MAVDVNLSEFRSSPNFTENQPLYPFVEVVVGSTTVSDFTDDLSDTVMDFSFTRTAKQNTVGNPGDSFTLTLYDDTAIEIESVIYNIILSTVELETGTDFDNDGKVATDLEGGTVPAEDSNTEDNSDNSGDNVVGRFFSESIRENVFGTPTDSGTSIDSNTDTNNETDETNTDDTSKTYGASDGGGNVSNITVTYGWADSKGSVLVSNTVNGYFTKYSMEFEGASTVLSIEGVSEGTLELNSPSNSTYREYPATKWKGIASDIVKDVIDNTKSLKYTEDSIEETEAILGEDGKPKSFIMEGETPEEFIKNKLCEEAKSKKSGRIGYSFYTDKGIAYFKPSDTVKGTKVESATYTRGVSASSLNAEDILSANTDSNISVDNDIEFDTDLFRDVLVNEDDYDGYNPNNDGLEDSESLYIEESDDDLDWDEESAYRALDGEDYTSPIEEYDAEEEDSSQYYGDDDLESRLGVNYSDYKKDRLLNLKEYRQENNKVNHRQAVVDAANIIYRYSKKCRHTNKDVKNWVDMKKLKRSTSDSCVYISLQEADVLRKDETIGFNGWDNIYGMNYIRSAYRRHTIESYYETPYLRFPYTKLPKKYREEGCVYIFRHSAGINMGNGYIYICNGAKRYSKVKGRDLDYESYFGIQLAIRPSDGYKYEDSLTEIDGVLSASKLGARKNSNSEGLKLLFSCMEKAADQYKAYGTKYGNPCKSSAGKIRKTTNCCTYIGQGLYNYVNAIGKPKMFPKGSEFWLNHEFHGCEEFKKHKDFYSMKKLNKSLKQAVKDGDLIPGDIAGFDPHHTMMYKGKNKKGDLIWYSFGRHSSWKTVKKGHRVYSSSKHIRTRIRINDISGNATLTDNSGGSSSSSSGGQIELPTEVKITGYYEFYSGQDNSQVISFSPEWSDVTAVGGEWLVDSANSVDTMRNEIITLEVNANHYTGQKVLKDSQSRILGKSSSSLKGLQTQASSMWEKNYSRMNTATMEIMGDPKVQTGSWIYVDVYTKYGILHHTSGVYYVEEAEDSISDGSFTTSLQLRKNGNYGQYYTIV